MGFSTTTIAKEAGWDEIACAPSCFIVGSGCGTFTVHGSVQAKVQHEMSFQSHPKEKSSGYKRSSRSSKWSLLRRLASSSGNLELEMMYADQTAVRKARNAQADTVFATKRSPTTP